MVAMNYKHTKTRRYYLHVRCECSADFTHDLANEYVVCPCCGDKFLASLLYSTEETT